MRSEIVHSSFRDPCGFLFTRDDVLYRQINKCYIREYEVFTECGLRGDLVKNDMLVSHDEVDIGLSVTDDAYKVIKPQKIPFISYPYEWCFSQLKDAALLTLDIQRRALERNMTLKDASAYNIQFLNGKPIFIDTLSFETYEEGYPWDAYKQFCQHFLAPLALMSRRDIRLNQLLRIYVDGIPLDLASSLLPYLTKMKPSLFFHIHLHAHSQRRYSNKINTRRELKNTFSRKAFTALLESLEGTLEKLEWEPEETDWYDYYEKNNNYGEEGIANKERIISSFLDIARPNIVWDLGANTGLFSRVVGAKGFFVVAWDNDPGCVECNYRMARKANETNILPLVLDIANPSPGIGWENNERMSFVHRGPVDLVLALGLIHHLYIGNNVSFGMMASFFANVCEWLIVEFIPKDDSQVQRLLGIRKDAFPDYTPESFVGSFEKLFTIMQVVKIPATKRTLYFMKLRNGS
jgi:hypothetical protein